MMQQQMPQQGMMQQGMMPQQGVMPQQGMMQQGMGQPGMIQQQAQPADNSWMNRGNAALLQEMAEGKPPPGTAPKDAPADGERSRSRSPRGNSVQTTQWDKSAFAAAAAQHTSFQVREQTKASLGKKPEMTLYVDVDGCMNDAKNTQGRLAIDMNDEYFQNWLMIAQDMNERTKLTLSFMNSQPLGAKLKVRLPDGSQGDFTFKEIITTL